MLGARIASRCSGRSWLARVRYSSAMPRNCRLSSLATLTVSSLVRSRTMAWMADREKFRLELFAGADVDGNNRIGKAELFQHDRDFPAIRRRRVIEVDHGFPSRSHYMAVD